MFGFAPTRLFDASTYSMNDLLLSLRVISKTQANNRIGRNADGLMALESTNPLLCSLRRFFCGTNRAKNIAELSDVVMHAEEKSKDLMDSKHLGDGDSPESNAVHSQLHMLQTYLQECIKGLESLRLTYSADPNSVAKLDLLCKKVARIVSEIGSRLHAS